MKTSKSTTTRKRFRIISIVVFVIVFASSSISAYAVDKPCYSTDNMQGTAYQEVLDKLNAEYGTDVHFATEEECALYGISRCSIDVSLIEFEKQMRIDIEENIRANNEAKEASRKLETIRVDEYGCFVCPADDLTKSSQTVTRSKNVPGATVYLTATVDNAAGFWQYKYINSVYATYTAGYNSPPAFQLLSIVHSFIDSRRTCALSLYGVTVGNWGVIIDQNAYRYVEFWAGSGM